MLNRNQNPNPRPETSGASTTIRCANCKKEGHERIQCWFLHPSLRPKKKGSGRGDRKGENRIDRTKERGGGDSLEERREIATHSVKRINTQELLPPFSSEMEESICGAPEGSNSTNFFGAATSVIKSEISKLISSLNGLLNKPNSGSFNLKNSLEVQSEECSLGPNQMRYVIPNRRINKSPDISETKNGEIKPIKCTNLGNLNKEYSKNNLDWILDSGATDHMTGNKNLLHNYKIGKGQEFVYVANGEKMKICGYGSIIVFSKEIKDVLHVKNCTANLLSMGKLSKELNCEIIFSPQNVFFQDIVSKRMIGEGVFKNGLYFLYSRIYNFNTQVQDMGHLWHKRIGHPSDRTLKCIFNFSNLDCSNCEVCKLAKHTRLPFANSNSKSNHIFELVHSDVWGPAPVNSYNDFKYFVTFIDDFSRLTYLYLLKNKSEVFSHFQDFSNLIENQYNTRIKILRTDNGTEFVNQNFSNFLKQKGIIHQTTCVYTPQQNGISERKNRHLLEMTRALMFQTNVPKIYWSDAVLTATYLINRLPSVILKIKVH